MPYTLAEYYNFSVSTLLPPAISVATGLNIQPQANIVRAAERLRFPELPDREDVAYDFEALNFHTPNRSINAYLACFRVASARARLHAHDAAEFLYVMTGTLLVQVDGIDYRLEAGDSIHINAGVPHGYFREGEAACAAIVVTTGDRGEEMSAGEANDEARRNGTHQR